MNLEILGVNLKNLKVLFIIDTCICHFVWPINRLVFPPFKIRLSDYEFFQIERFSLFFPLFLVFMRESTRL